MAYLIDTDILVDYIRGNLDAAAYLQSLDEWSYSVVTAMELFAGAQNKRQIRAIEKVLKNFRETPKSRSPFLWSIVHSCPNSAAHCSRKPTKFCRWYFAGCACRMSSRRTTLHV